MKSRRIGILLFILLSCSFALGAFAMDSIFGDWVAIRIIPSNAISCYSDEEAQQLIGQRLLLSAKLAVQGKDACLFPQYVIKEESAYDFYRAFKTELSEMGVEGDLIKRIEIYQDGNLWWPFDELYIRDEDTLIALCGGIFLEMKRGQPDK